MARVDLKNKSIQAKLVYYGPGLCGKTTNLQRVNEIAAKDQKLMSLATEGDRTIFFDFMPLDLGTLRGMSVKFKLYTVPGQVRYNQTRKMVLKNVDGIVFVADSQELMLDANLESLDNLYDNLKELGIDSGKVPVILQYNKRDLPTAMAVGDLDTALNANRRYETYLASAHSGEGVMETVKAATRAVIKNLMGQFGELQAGGAAATRATGATSARSGGQVRSQRSAAVKVAGGGGSVGSAATDSTTRVPSLAKTSAGVGASSATRSGNDGDGSPDEPSIPKQTDVRSVLDSWADKREASERAVIDKIERLVSEFGDRTKTLQKATEELSSRIGALEKAVGSQAPSSVPDDKRLDGVHRTLSTLSERMSKLEQAVSAVGKSSAGGGSEASLQKLIEGLPKKDELERLRASIEGTKTAGGSRGPSAATLDTKQLEKVLAAKKDIELLRKDVTDLAKLGSKADVEALRKEVADLAKPGGKAELEALRKEVAGLAARVQSGGAASIAGDVQVASLRKDVAGLATKSELTALKSSLSGLADKSELRSLKSDIAKLPTKADLAALRSVQADSAAKSELAVLKSELSRLPTKADLAALQSAVVALVATRPAASAKGTVDVEVPARSTEAKDAEPGGTEGSKTAQTEGAQADVATAGQTVPRATEPTPKADGAEETAPASEAAESQGAGAQAEAEPKADEEDAKAAEPRDDKESQREAEDGEKGSPVAEAGDEEPKAAQDESGDEEPKATEGEAGDKPAPQVDDSESPEAEASKAEEPKDAARPADEEGDPFADDPKHKNAARIARVMVADLYLYNRNEVEAGIRADDFYDRNKEALADMRETYESRVAAEVLKERDYLALAIEKMIEDKRKKLSS